MNKLHYLWLIPLVALFSLTLATPTLAGGQAPKVTSIYVEGYDNELYNTNNFYAFAGSKVFFIIESDTALTATNSDGADITTTAIDSTTYRVGIESTSAMKTQVIFSNAYGYSFKNITFEENDISKIDFKTQTMIAKTQINEFKLIFNDNSQLKNTKEVTYKLKLSNGDEIALDASSSYVSSISNNGISLDFSTLTNIDGTFTLYASVGNIQGQTSFSIKDVALSSTFVLMSDNINYLTDATELTVNAKIDSQSFAKFEVLDNYIRLKNAQLIYAGESYDEYTLTLDISNVTDSYSVIISCPTTNGNTLRGVYINSISSVTDFKITSEKTSYSPNETIIVTAVINGNASLSAEIEWYLNGVLASTGTQFSFSRSEGGAFTISAKIGEIESNSLSLNISYAGTELIVWYIVFIVALLFLIGLILFRKKKKDFFMSAYLTDRARKIIPRFNTQFNNYSKHQFRDLLYDTANLREDTTQNYHETKNLDFERASRELGNVIKAMREIYKAPKESRQEMFIKYSTSIENSMENAIKAYEHFNSTHPNEKFFTFKNSKKKNKNDKNNNHSVNENTQAQIDNTKAVDSSSTIESGTNTANIQQENTQTFADVYNLDTPQSETLEIENQPTDNQDAKSGTLYTSPQANLNTDCYNLDTPHSETIDISDWVSPEQQSEIDDNQNFPENSTLQIKDDLNSNTQSEQTENNSTRIKTDVNNSSNNN